MTEFTISADFVKVVESLGDAEVGRLFVAMCEYALSGTEAKLRGNERMLWAASKLMIDGSLIIVDESVKKHTINNNNNNNINNSSSNKNTKKHTLTEYDVAFEHFWTEYPKDRRIDKQLAYAEWKKINPDDELVEKIVESVKTWKKCEQWQDPQFIPHPAKFLKLQRWEAAVPGRKKKFDYESNPISEEDFNALCVNLDEQTDVNMNEIRFD